MLFNMIFFFKQKTAYEMRISDWSSDVCSSDLMGLAPIYQRPRTSDPHPRHRVYPYLLRKLAIERPNHVWCADVTYIPMRKGFLYLMAVMDWASRKEIGRASCRERVCQYV